MNYVIPVSELARSFHTQTTIFLNENNLDPKMFSYSKCEDLVICFLYKALSERFKWLSYEIENSLGNYGLSEENGGVVFSDNDVFVDERFLNAEINYVKSLNRLFDWFILDADEEQILQPDVVKEILLSNEYDSTVIDDVWLGIIEMVNSIIPRKTWMMWKVKKMGRDILLVEEEDYRVFDWNRRNLKPKNVF